MMTFLLKLFTLTLSFTVIFASNPVKVSMVLLAISIGMFFLMAIGSSVWFPTLFALLFMGGILMMFMILSSILPNEKSGKMNVSLWVVGTTTALSTFLAKTQDHAGSAFGTKEFLNSSMTFFSLILLLLLYFFSVIAMLCKEETPMRMITCCSGKLIL